MRKQKALFVGMILASCVFSIGIGHAKAIRAVSCSQPDIQAAINSSVTGDIITVPSGNCTWTGNVSIPNSKRIVLSGAGMNSTVITRNPVGLTITLNQSGSRVTGFSFINGKIEADGYDFRIDHCRMSFSFWSDGIAIMSRNVNPAVISTGVIDNCDFHNMRVLVNGTNYMLNENNAQHGLWASPLRLGTAEAVYIEDNTFTGGVNAVDGNYGGRYVFRNNTLNDVYIEAHSVQATNRAIRKWEIYFNTINQVNKAMWVPMFLRGGTGVIFNNSLTGNWTLPQIALDNVRSCDSAGVGGKCDGSSPWDGAGEKGYPCRDQVGRSTDQWLWTTANPYPPQAHEPAYAWNNKHGANDVVFFQHNCDQSKSHIQPNRDYYNNVQKPGFTPYTYPHPLRKPSPPLNLKISN